jgi:hypothetical protein
VLNREDYMPYENDSRQEHLDPSLRTEENELRGVEGVRWAWDGVMFAPDGSPVNLSHRDEIFAAKRPLLLTLGKYKLPEFVRDPLGDPGDKRERIAGNHADSLEADGVLGELRWTHERLVGWIECRHGRLQPDGLISHPGHVALLKEFRAAEGKVRGVSDPTIRLALLDRRFAKNEGGRPRKTR